MDSGRGKPVAPVIIDGRKGVVEEDDDDDTFIVEEDPALQNILEMVRVYCVSQWAKLPKKQSEGVRF